jgi:hypothetical protein
MPTTNNENSILSQYYTEEEVAEFLSKTINSLRADASRRKGAPRTVIGKRVLYNKNSFEAWVLEKEVMFGLIFKKLGYYQVIKL